MPHDFMEERAARNGPPGPKERVRAAEGVVDTGAGAQSKRGAPLRQSWMRSDVDTGAGARSKRLAGVRPATASGWAAAAGSR